MMIFLILVFGCYIILMLVLLYGWERALTPLKLGNSDLKSITVIVPVRNEEENLERIFQSCNALNYPAEKLEIIFVNDHSSDNSVKLLQDSNFTIINQLQEKHGKKDAISFGIANSKSEIIVTTDADCTHHPDWLQSINLLFQNPHTQLVVGSVAMRRMNSFFDRLQSIEFSSLIGSGAALLQFQIPAMANGANLAFRREAFLEVDGYIGNEHIPSGDDEYLLRKIFSTYPEGVVFNNQSNAVVETKPQSSIRSFFKQRIRWAGKWKHQTSTKLKILAFIVFFFQMFFLTMLYLFIAKSNREITLLLLTKVAMEGIFLWRVCLFLQTKFSLMAFMLLQLLYPVYVIVTAITSLIVPVDWKDRKS